MIDEKKLINELKQSGMIADNEYGNAMVDTIENQQKIGEWIPCSERLPEVPEGIEDDDCPEFNVTIKGAKEATTLRCDSEGTWFDDHGNLYPVIAWQPLPEAYHEAVKN